MEYDYSVHFLIKCTMQLPRKPNNENQTTIELSPFSYYKWNTRYVDLFYRKFSRLYDKNKKSKN